MTGAGSIDSREGKQIRFQTWPHPVPIEDVISAKELAGQSLLITGLPLLPGLVPGAPGAVQDPVHWVFVDAFPMTPSGKIQKFKLRESFTANRA